MSKYSSRSFVDAENKLVGPDVFITPEMKRARWKGGKELPLTKANRSKFLDSVLAEHGRAIYTFKRDDNVVIHPVTGEEITYEPKKTHEDYPKWKDLIENFEYDADNARWVPKAEAEAESKKQPDVITEHKKELEEAKKSSTLRPLKSYERKGASGLPLPPLPEPKTKTEAPEDFPLPDPMVLFDPPVDKPFTGRRRTLHRQRYGKELSERLAEGLKTGEFDTVGEKDVKRRGKLGLTDDQSTLFLKKELAKTIESNIAADKDYYKKDENLDELENIFSIGEQIDPWSGNMSQANIERYISKVENRKPTRQEIYEQGKAELARKHAARFGDSWEPPVPLPRVTLTPRPDARVEPDQRRATVGAPTRSRHGVGTAPRSYWTGKIL